AMIYEVPESMLTRQVGFDLGAQIGPVRKVHTDNKGWVRDCFLRVRVELDVNMPLKCWAKIKDEEDKLRYCPVKYERLPHFCFFCGRIGHTDRHCMMPENEKKFGGTGVDGRAEGMWRHDRQVTSHVREVSATAPIRLGASAPPPAREVVMQNPAVPPLMDEQVTAAVNNTKIKRSWLNRYHMDLN
ncbi:hypothetical protein BRADI_2g04046v3, partial [Brachypodium distachyon]